MPSRSPFCASRIAARRPDDSRSPATSTWCSAPSTRRRGISCTRGYDAVTGALFAQNLFAPDFTTRVAFSWISEPVTGYTARRDHFIGRNGDLAAPAGLRAEDDSPARPARDTTRARRCGARSRSSRTRRKTSSILLGAAPSDLDARALIDRYRPPAAAAKAIDEAIGRVGRAAVGDPRSHTGAGVRHAVQSMVACTRRCRAECGRGPRCTSLAARTGFETSCRTAWRSCTPNRPSRARISSRRRAAVRRGRRAALVARAVGARRAHALLRRSGVVAVRRRSLRSRHGRRLGVGRARAVSRHARRSPPTNRKPTTCRR